jgi:nitrous oxide reductase accessory protein NosL
MSKSGRIILVIAMAAAMAACAKKEEEVMVEPITVEPTETGKYK